MKLLLNAWLERKSPKLEIFNSNSELLFTLDSLQLKELFDSGDLCLPDLDNTKHNDISLTELIKLYIASFGTNGSF